MDVARPAPPLRPPHGFCGNSNIQVWETGDREAIRREVLRKLNAARGGGLIFQSDHSVSSAVSGHTYDYIVKLVRQYGKYPLRARRVRGVQVATGSRSRCTRNGTEMMSHR